MSDKYTPFRIIVNKLKKKKKQLPVKLKVFLLRASPIKGRPGCTSWDLIYCSPAAPHPVHSVLCPSKVLCVAQCRTLQPTAPKMLLNQADVKL